MVAAGAARRRDGRAPVGHAVSGDRAAPAAAVAPRHLYLLHQLGLVVVAGQVALGAGMAGGAGSAPGAVGGMTHPHSVSILVAVVCVAGALFTVGRR
nr:hypothetical protein BJQ95_01615 [Cryobacterium sp. SO1]